MEGKENRKEKSEGERGTERGTERERKTERQRETKSGIIKLKMMDSFPPMIPYGCTICSIVLFQKLHAEKKR